MLRSDAEARQRRGLLAKIHIAKQQMALSDGEYEMILRSFKVGSAADLSLRQLENMVKLLKHYGWKASVPNRKSKPNEDRIVALKERVRVLSLGILNGEKRLPGLVKKICGVDSLAWCQDADKLERLLAAIGKIKEEAYGET
ncbi:MAG: DUF1018 domain-containing protein [Syntrophales bacterium]|nr:DUF1018 domain-containing protein [Syntrophales bacterium]